MGRYIDAVCRLCRREREKLFLKGTRCYTKCAIERRVSGKRVLAPGQHGEVVKKLSDYSLQLREKQKVKRIYGIMERQFKNYFIKALKMKGVTSDNLFILLERRLDNIVYRLNFASSRPQARQLVRHCHVKVNNRRINLPSYSVSKGDEISIKEDGGIRERVAAFIESIGSQKQVPAWLELDTAGLIGKILRLPSKDDIDHALQGQLIVEYYSR